MVNLEMHIYAVVVWDGNEEPKLLTHLREVGARDRGVDAIFSGSVCNDGGNGDYGQSYYFARDDVAWSGNSQQKAEDQYIVALAAWRLTT